MARADAVATGGVLLLATVAVHEAGKLALGTVGNPGPGFLPWWAGVTLGLVTLVRLGQIWISGPKPETGGPVRRVMAVWGLVVALAAYVAVLERIGYPLSTFLLVLFLLRLVEPRRWTVALGVAAVAAIGSFVVFAVWLGVPLPPGPSLR
jgi:putative tricarboxylic transport membrane protein